MVNLIKDNKNIFVVGIFLVLVSILLIVFLLWRSSLVVPVVVEQCVDVNNVVTYTFDSCYDAASQTVVVSVKRSVYDPYDISSLRISFTDDSSHDYSFSDLPAESTTKVLTLSATTNPVSLYVSLNTSQVLSSQQCTVPRRVFVRDCDNSDVASTRPVYNQVKPNQTDYKEIFLDVSVKEQLWKTQCASKWDCTAWEECSGGVQRRSCNDSVGCAVSTSLPQTVRYCSQTCIEDWDCSWSDCVGGFTVPSCMDKNSCGSEFNKPNPVSCDIGLVCEPDIVCGSWSDCSVEYDLFSVESQDINTLPGKKSRVCSDRNGCLSPVVEKASCSMSVDVYTKRYAKCNNEYVDVYDRLDDSLIARLDKGGQNNPYLNILLEDGLEVYCDYCFNGVLDGDELRVDCGGSCQSCEKPMGQINLGGVSFFEKVKRFIILFGY